MGVATSKSLSCTDSSCRRVLIQRSDDGCVKHQVVYSRVINREPPPYWPNAVSIFYETAEVETCAVMKANFSANFDVYSNISDAETLENSCNQFSAMFSQIYSGITGITGRTLLYVD